MSQNELNLTTVSKVFVDTSIIVDIDRGKKL